MSKKLKDGGHEKDFREQKYKYRWVRYLTFPLLIGFVLLLILSNINYEDCLQSHNDTTTESSTDINITSSIHTFKRDVTETCINEKCNVQCTNGVLKNFGKQLEDLNNGCSSLIVDITNCQFPDDKIKQNWLDGTVNAKISILRIVNSELNEIEENSMYSTAVEKMEIFHLERVQLKELKMYTFAFLYQLKELVIHNSNKKFEGNKFLGWVAATIERFTYKSLVETSAINPEIWFQQGSYHKLTMLDIGSNNFDDKLKLTTFSDFKKVEELILMACHISSLKDDVFDAVIKTLTYIDLRDNHLTTLTPVLMNKFVSPMEVLIGGNRFNCTCDPKGFVHSYREKIGIFDEYVYCSDPENYRGLLISNEFVCQIPTPAPPTPPSTTTKTTTMTTAITTTTTEQSITSTTTIPDTTDKTSTVRPTSVTTTKVTTTTIKPPELIEIDCMKSLNTIRSVYSISASDVNFTLSTISSTSVRIDIKSKANYITVLWFYQIINLSNENQFVTGCQEIDQNELTVRDLKEYHTYTFCVITESNVQVSPYNCQGYHTNRYVQKLTIIFLSIGIFLALIGGGLIVFLLIRWRPNILKGNKRLIFLNKSQTNVLVLPQNACKTSTNFTKTCSTSKRYLPRRRMSDISIGSGRSYIMPNFYEAVQYQKTMEYEIAKERIYYEDFPTNTPPPVPKRTINTTEYYKDENSYIYLRSVCP